MPFWRQRLPSHSSHGHPDRLEKDNGIERRGKEIGTPVGIRLRTLVSIRIRLSVSAIVRPGRISLPRLK